MNRPTKATLHQSPRSHANVRPPSESGAPRRTWRARIALSGKTLGKLMLCGAGTGMALVILAGSGCAATGTATVEKRALTYRVKANAMILEDTIRITESHAQKVNGLLKVQVRGENATGKTLRFEYRFVWLDSGGVVAETPTSIWKPMRLAAGETVFLNGMAATPDAEDFLMTLRLK
jgi:uncharacterized protein YcfL